MDDYIYVFYFIQRSQLCSCQPFCTADFSTSPATLEAEVIYWRPLLGTGQLAAAANPPSQRQPRAGRAPGSAPRFPRKPLSPGLINRQQITCVVAAGMAASPSILLAPAMLGSALVVSVLFLGLLGREGPAPGVGGLMPKCSPWTGGLAWGGVCVSLGEGVLIAEGTR